MIDGLRESDYIGVESQEEWIFKDLGEGEFKKGGGGVGGVVFKPV